jgi:hypothetical protein
MQINEYRWQRFHKLLKDVRGVYYIKAIQNKLEKSSMCPTQMCKVWRV